MCFQLPSEISTAESSVVDWNIGFYHTGGPVQLSTGG